MDPGQQWHILNDPNYTEATLDDPSSSRIVVETVVDSETGDVRLVGRPPTIENELDEVQELIQKAKGQLDRLQANSEQTDREHLSRLIELLEKSEDMLQDLLQGRTQWPEYASAHYGSFDQFDLGGEG